MVSNEIRSEVWLELWDSIRLNRYYASLHRRYTNAYRLMSILVLLSGSGAAAAIANLLPSRLALPLSLAVVAVSAFMALYNLASMAAIAHAVSLDCQQLESRLRRLLRTADTDGTEKSVQDRLDEIKSDIISTTASAGIAGITQSDKLNVQATQKPRPCSKPRPAMHKKGITASGTPSRPRHATPPKEKPRPNRASEPDTTPDRKK